MIMNSHLIVIVEILLAVLPALLSVAYITVAERKTMASIQKILVGKTTKVLDKGSVQMTQHANTLESNFFKLRFKAFLKPYNILTMVCTIFIVTFIKIILLYWGLDINSLILYLGAISVVVTNFLKCFTDIISIPLNKSGSEILIKNISWKDIINIDYKGIWNQILSTFNNKHVMTESYENEKIKNNLQTFMVNPGQSTQGSSSSSNQHTSGSNVNTVGNLTTKAIDDIKVRPGGTIQDHRCMGDWIKEAYQNEQALAEQSDLDTSEKRVTMYKYCFETERDHAQEIIKLDRDIITMAKLFERWDNGEELEKKEVLFEYIKFKIPLSKNDINKGITEAQTNYHMKVTKYYESKMQRIIFGHKHLTDVERNNVDAAFGLCNSAGVRSSKGLIGEDIRSVFPIRPSLDRAPLNSFWRDRENRSNSNGESMALYNLMLLRTKYNLVPERWESTNNQDSFGDN